MDDALYLFGELPLHPLVIHVVVVLAPILAIGLLVSAFVAKIRKKFLGILVGGIGITTGFALLARGSGEELAEVVGVSQQHERFGDALPLWLVGLFVVSLGWFLVEKKGGSRILVVMTTTSVAILAVVVTVLTILVGHSGAESVWASRIAIPEAQPTATPTASPSTDAITLGAVAEHATADDCWTTINGDVYDVTEFIDAHPGGAAALTALCGRDGTDDFMSQHSSNGSALSQLAALRIGTLSP